MQVVESCVSCYGKMENEVNKIIPHSGIAVKPRPGPKPRDFRSGRERVRIHALCLGQLRGATLDWAEIPTAAGRALSPSCWSPPPRRLRPATSSSTRGIGRRTRGQDWSPSPPMDRWTSVHRGFSARPLWPIGTSAIIIDMRVEIDQSGKIGEKGPTALALSNDVDYKILIPAAVKRECIRVARAQNKSGKAFYLQLFSIALFLLLRDHIGKCTLVVIDREYRAKDKDIKGFLMNLLRRDGQEVSPETITFENVGRHSNAHKKAKATYRGELVPDRVIRTEEIMEQFVARRPKTRKSGPATGS